MNNMQSLGRQIRLLREAFGETQLELALALGYDSPSTISMYENGWRGRNSCDIVSRIVRHYRITADTLFHTDFSGVNFLAMPFEKPETARVFFLKILPIQNLSENTQAETGGLWTSHTDAAKHLAMTMRFQEQDFRTFMTGYRALSGQEQSKDILANMLWWHIVRDLFHCYPKIMAGLRDLLSGQISKKEFFRDHYLVSATADGMYDAADDDEKRRTYLSLQNGNEEKLLRMLYQSAGGTALAEYYAALRIRFALITDSCHDDACLAAAGEEMMQMLACIGNPYAAVYRNAIDQLHRV